MTKINKKVISSNEDLTWIKLYRKSINSTVFNNDTLWKIWTWCLMKANHKTKNVFFLTGKNGITIKVKEGSFIFGRHTASEELHKPGSTIWYNMQKLEKLNMIKIKSNKQYSIIYIRNWEFYQSKNGQATDKQLTSNGQATDTNNNDKNDKNDNNKLKTIYCSISEKMKREDERQKEIDKKLARYLGNHIKKRQPKNKSVKKQEDCNYIKWGKYIRLMREQDDREPEKIKEIIEWCQKDDFWQDNILSTSKLRKQYDKLELKMKKGGSKDDSWLDELED